MAQLNSRWKEQEDIATKGGSQAWRVPLPGAPSRVSPGNYRQAPWPQIERLLGEVRNFIWKNSYFIFSYSVSVCIIDDQYLMLLFS